MDRKKRKLGKDGKATAEAVSSASSPPTLPGEPRALDSTPDKPEPDKPEKSDELYRQGDELYAAGLFQQAIHVWTRILFIERGDVRAKKAIDRAKRAVSERQRELDAELAGAAALLDDGDIDAAAARVRHVLSRDPRYAEAHQLAERIAARDRRPAGPASVGGRGSAASNDVAESAPSSKRGLLLRVSRTAAPGLRPGTNPSALKMAGFALAVILVFASGALYLHLNWDSIVSDGAFVVGGALQAGGGEPVDAVVPGASELHYYNGARLYSKGRYREALAELTLVARDDVVSERARSLILRIEERLLRGGELPDPGRAPSEAVR